ncbi:MAG TPA: hypothetical protein VGN14_08290 [Candidatus Elarobacter sp.]
MSQLILITGIYVTGGLVLAVLMFLTASRVSELGKTTGQVLDVAFGNVKIGTSSILVGLAIVSFAAMVGVPTYYLYLSHQIDDHAMQLVVQFDPPPNSDIQVISDPSQWVLSNSVLRVYRSGDWQSFSVAPQRGALPLPLRVRYDVDKGVPFYTYQYGVTQPVKDFRGDSGTIVLPSVTLTPPPNKTSASTASASVSAQLRDLPDPGIVRTVQAAQPIVKPENP